MKKHPGTLAETDEAYASCRRHVLEQLGNADKLSEKRRHVALGSCGRRVEEAHILARLPACGARNLATKFHGKLEEKRQREAIELPHV